MNCIVNNYIFFSVLKETINVLKKTLNKYPFLRVYIEVLQTNKNSYFCNNF